MREQGDKKSKRFDQLKDKDIYILIRGAQSNITYLSFVATKGKNRKSSDLIKISIIIMMDILRLLGLPKKGRTPRRARLINPTVPDSRDTDNTALRLSST